MNTAVQTMISMSRVRTVRGPAGPVPGRTKTFPEWKDSGTCRLFRPNSLPARLYRKIEAPIAVIR